LSLYEYLDDDAAEAADATEEAEAMSKRGFFIACPIRTSVIPAVPFRLLSDNVSGIDNPGFVGVTDLELLALPLQIIHQ
jgi:hypothetical protein